MGPGGLPNLQNCVSGGAPLTGGFDSHAPSPPISLHPCGFFNHPGRGVWRSATAPHLLQATLTANRSARLENGVHGSVSEWGCREAPPLTGRSAACSRSFAAGAGCAFRSAPLRTGRRALDLRESARFAARLAAAICRRHSGDEGNRVARSLYHFSTSLVTPRHAPGARLRFFC